MIIQLTNVGPIANLALPVPEDGGVVVLRGRNGIGKSKALEAIECAVSGRGRIDVRDGQRRGEVEAFGVSVKIGRSTRRAGELEVHTIDGRLDIAELVDPGIKSPEAADARRIKALVQISGAKPDRDLFHHLLGGKDAFDQIVSTAAIAAEDLVVMADRIKRDIETAARQQESQADHAEGRARGAREAAAGIDVSQESDAAVLQEALETAVRSDSGLREQSKASEAARRAHQAARDALEDSEANYDGPILATAVKGARNAKERLDAAKLGLLVAERSLTLARQEVKEAEAALGHAMQIESQVEHREATMKAWRDTLARPLPDSVSAEQLQASSQTLQAARERVETGALVRRAKQHLEDARKAAAEAVEHRQRAEQLRDAARGTDEVLSDVVASTGGSLRVESGRLVTDTWRGVTHFSDLSHGEQWKIALDIGIESVGQKGLLVIDQEAWEGLDPQNRQLIAEHVRDRGVLIITAESSDHDEIVPDVM